MAKAFLDHPPAVPAAPDDDRYLSLRQLEEYSGLSERSLRRALNHPKQPLPSFRFGKRLLVRRSDFDRWIETVNRPATLRPVSRGDVTIEEIREQAAVAARLIRGDKEK